MGSALIIKNGSKFNRWTVVKEIERVNRRRTFECKCECGTVRGVRIDRLVDRSSISCGCYNIEQLKKTAIHGDWDSRLYRIHKGMKQRCNNKNSTVFAHYGGRGIKLHEDWNDYVHFKEWALLNGYDECLTIDRIDVNGNYEPSNCRWVTMKDQRKNTRQTINICHQGKTMCSTDWDKELGLTRGTISNRLRSGWSEEEALRTPKLKRGQRKNA